MITSVVLGKRYKVIDTKSFGSPPNIQGRVVVGRCYECVNTGGLNGRTQLDPYNTITIRCENGSQLGIYLADLAEGWTTRAEHADSLEEELKDLDKRHKEIDKKASELKHAIKRLREFESDEEEIAAMMVRAMKDSELSEKDAINNLAKTLKGRLRTDLL